MATRMLQRRGTAAEWAAQNPILSDGEIGFETDTKIVKLGDGVAPWVDLETNYIPKTGGAMTGSLSLIAPTADVHAVRRQDVVNVPVGGIVMFSGTILNLSDNWALCDGTNGTPDLRGRFIVGAEGAYAQGAIGGVDTVALTELQMPSHTHGNGGLATVNGGAHDHRLEMAVFATSQQHSHNHSARAAAQSHDSTGVVMSGVASAVEDSLDHTHALTGSTGSAGSGNSHENLPPYYALAYIMRIS